MKKKLLIPITAAIALILAAALLFVPTATITAQAVSLDHIEEIKKDKADSNSSFLIIEIAPSSEDGTIGYYVANQEPSANWPQRAAAVSGQDERTTFVNILFSTLRDKGLLSSGNTTPLTQAGDYIEYYPWEAPPANATQLVLNSSEDVTVTGNFTKQEGGDYEANVEYSLDTANGTALQIVSSFEYSTASQADSYYYALDFTPIVAGTELDDGTKVYRGNFETKTLTEDPVTESKEEIVEGDGSGIDTTPVETKEVSEPVTEGNVTTVTTTTTKVTKTVEPYTTEVVTPPTTETETGTETGTEAGETSEPTEPTVPAEPVTVVTSVKVTTSTETTVSKEVTALHHVIYEGVVGQGLALDLEEHYFTISLTPGTTPSAQYTAQNCYRAVGAGFADAPEGESGFFRADIISYYYAGEGKGSYSFSQTGSGSYSGRVSCNTVYYTGGYTNNNWFRTGALDCTSDETFPVVVRSYSPSEAASHLDLLATADLIVLSPGLSGSGCSLSTAVRTAIEEAAEAGTPLMIDSSMTGKVNSTLTEGISSGGVKENVYVFSGSYFTNNCIAGPSFRTNLPADSYYAQSAPFHAVYQEISYENTLRGRQGITALPEEVSEATCLRYIINYAGHRVENKKTSLRVLDVEPMSSVASISKADVKSWLPDSSFTDAQITITCMAAGELLGHIEDVSENYDLIYIGASSTNTSNLLDTGFRYANIGASYSVNSNLAGLSGGQTARFSGNDLNATKYSQLLSYARSGYPVVIADSLIDEGRAPTSISFSATASGSISQQWVRDYGYGYGGGHYVDYANLSVSVSGTLPVGSTVSYQWYKGNQAIPGANQAAYSFRTDSYGNNNKNYYCEVRVTYQKVTGTAKSNLVRVSDENITYNISISRKQNGNSSNATYTASVTSGGSAVSGLTYRWDHADMKIGWFDNWSAIGGATGNSASTKKYHVRVTITFPNGSEETFEFTSYDRFPISSTYSSSGCAVSYPTPDGASAGSITIAGIEGGIETTTVDINSYWYKLLNNVYSMDNVFSVTDAKNLKDRVLQSVNLSQPTLTISGDRQYSESNPAGSSLSDRTLYANFTIDNPTDATPSSTRYYAYFYIDKNADGKFSDDELLSDTAFYNSSGSMVSSGQLKAGEDYHISRRFASTYTGIIPWKLEVVKVGQTGAHASQVHYAYIKPADAKHLRVLQICKGSHSVTDYSEGGSGSVYRSSIFNSISGVSVTKHDTDDNRLVMKIKDDFVLDLYILNVDMVNNYANGYANSYITDLLDEFYGEDRISNPSLSDVLQKFDMIILGFGDMYGNFNNTSAHAVVNFINTGKAILFCHDTTSFHNSDTSGWGYQFNQVDRDAVGLDRYGVTGKNASSGYTSAKTPGQSSGTNSIQGFTSYTMKRYPSGSGDKGTRTTTTVTKVNTGQITTYPFTLGSTITTKTTHDQYYQLNMSGDDMTVWYCLGGSAYDDTVTDHKSDAIKNDCLNAYYIYNRGNVTYTGAGHENGFTTDEAKLFINTMIAAYRAAASAPDFSFRRSDDSADQGYLLLSQDESQNADGTITKSIPGEQKVYFKVIDTNIASSLSISARFYYLDSGNKVYLTPTIVRTDTQETETGSLRSYVLYEFELPEDLLTKLCESSTGVLKLYGEATTSIGGSTYGTYTSAPASIEMRVVQQLNLS